MVTGVINPIKKMVHGSAETVLRPISRRPHYEVPTVYHMHASESRMKSSKLQLNVAVKACILRTSLYCDKLNVVGPIQVLIMLSDYS